MQKEIVPLWKDGTVKSSVTRFVRPDDSAVRPAMLVVPGGGYGCVCESTEGSPVAEKFASLGFQVFVLDYRVAPHRFPEPQQDLFRAIKLIRSRASEWHVNGNQLAICGFSAGGHLCASAGTLWKEIDANDGDAADAQSARPDAMLLAYPVISSGPKAHKGSIVNLLGERYEELKDAMSLENRVTEDTPPAFVWHTAKDNCVPVENSLLFEAALRTHGVPCELHIFPFFDHGMQLGYGQEDIMQWPDQAYAFLHNSCKFTFPRRTVVLTFDDAVKSHYENVMPLLLAHGFGATFFPCRFNDKWRAAHPENLMTAEQLKALSDAGFEIGNHTWNHPDLRELPPEDIQSEIDRMKEFLKNAGIPDAVSFAYPGGPFAPNAADILRKNGFRFARTTETSEWDTASCDPMRVPAIPLQHGDWNAFLNALKHADAGKPVVLVYHGVPDEVHSFVSTSFPDFARQMKYLRDNGYHVVSMRDAGKSE